MGGTGTRRDPSCCSSSLLDSFSLVLRLFPSLLHVCAVGIEFIHAMWKPASYTVQVMQHLHSFIFWWWSNYGWMYESNLRVFSPPGASFSCFSGVQPACMYVLDAQQVLPSLGSPNLTGNYGFLPETNLYKKKWRNCTVSYDFSCIAEVWVHHVEWETGDIISVFLLVTDGTNFFLFFLLEHSV